MRVLGLDISSHCGWAVLEDKKLLEYGTLQIPSENQDWPYGIHAWSKSIADQAFQLILDKKCDKIVVERANSSRWRNSQNVLDWMHFAFLQRIIDNQMADKLIYVDTIAWRKKVDIKLNKDQKKQNQLISKSKKQGVKVTKIDGKRIGRITKKHLAILKVKELFNVDLKLKDNDAAEGILVAYSYFI